MPDRHVPQPTRPRTDVVDRQPARARLDSLTGLRWFAAFAVFTRHSGFGLPDAVAAQGATGVSFFFILSGFVLALSRREEGPGRFYQRRFARVYPAFVVTLVLAAFVHPEDIEPVKVAGSLTLTQAWSTSPDMYWALNGVAWSLDCEAFFYLLFPFLIPVLARLAVRTQRLLMVAVVALAILVPLAVATPDVGAGVGFWLIYIGPPVRTLEFVLGILLALEFRRGTRIPVPLWGAGALALAAYAVAGVVPSYAMWVATTIVPFGLLIFVVASGDADGRESWLRWRPLVVLGEISYVFYLVHARILEAGRRFAAQHDYRFDVFTVAALLVVAIAVAWVIHVAVERPLERWLRPRAA